MISKFFDKKIRESLKLPYWVPRYSGSRNIDGLLVVSLRLSSSLSRGVFGLHSLTRINKKQTTKSVTMKPILAGPHFFRSFIELSV